MYSRYFLINIFKILFIITAVTMAYHAAVETFGTQGYSAQSSETNLFYAGYGMLFWGLAYCLWQLCIKPNIAGARISNLVHIYVLATGTLLSAGIYTYQYYNDIQRGKLIENRPMHEDPRILPGTGERSQDQDNGSGSSMNLLIGTWTGIGKEGKHTNLSLTFLNEGMALERVQTSAETIQIQLRYSQTSKILKLDSISAIPASSTKILPNLFGHTIQYDVDYTRLRIQPYKSETGIILKRSE